MTRYIPAKPAAKRRAGGSRSGTRAHRWRPGAAAKVVRSFAQLRAVRSAEERHGLVLGASIPSRVVVEASAALAVPQSRVLDALGLREATFYRRLQAGKPIAAEKNERLVRLAEFAGLAASAFGDEEKGGRWLTVPNIALGGAAPLDMLGSSYGAERVRQALSVIEYGGVA